MVVISKIAHLESGLTGFSRSKRPIDSITFRSYKEQLTEDKWNLLSVRRLWRQFGLHRLLPDGYWTPGQAALELLFYLLLSKDCR